nr:helix-turn-helix domain-containing protein [Micromonospora sp. KC606]
MQAQNEIGDYCDSIKTAVRLVLWTLAWAATLALAKFGPRLLWDSQQPVASWAAVVVNLVVGIGWIVAFTRFLRAQDELQRQILQDALAVTLGAGWLGGFAYIVVDSRPRRQRRQYRSLPRAHGSRLLDRLRRRQNQIPVKNRITDLRTERGWTQAEPAQRIGVSRQTINATKQGSSTRAFQPPSASPSCST